MNSEPNTNPNNNDEFTDVYEGKDTVILYDLEEEQIILTKEE